MNFPDIFNPFNYVDPDKYAHLWQYLFANLLHGFWARLIASLSIIFSFWFGVYRRRLALGILFFVLSFVFTYLGSLLRVIFGWL